MAYDIQWPILHIPSGYLYKIESFLTSVEVFSKTMIRTSTVDGILESGYNSAEHRLFQWLIKSLWL